MCLRAVVCNANAVCIFWALCRPRGGELRHVQLHWPHFPTPISQLKQGNNTRLRFVLGHLVAFRMRLAACSFIPQLPRFGSWCCLYFLFGPFIFSLISRRFVFPMSNVFVCNFPEVVCNLNRDSRIGTWHDEDDRKREGGGGKRQTTRNGHGRRRRPRPPRSRANMALTTPAALKGRRG